MVIELSSLLETHQAIVNDVYEGGTPNERYDRLFVKLRKLILDELELCLQRNNEEGGKRLQELLEGCINVCEYLLGNKEEKPIGNLCKLLLVLFEDIVEGTPLPLLKSFYTAYRPFEKLCKKSLWTSDKGHELQFIRVCNQLLRRLPPKSKWSGIILLELAHRLPLDDKSSMKPWGSVSNKELELDDDNISTKNELEEDNNFYEKFWSLQNFFANPYKAANFGQFVANYTSVLAQLEACTCKLFINNNKIENKEEIKDELASIDPSSLHFLTNRRLLTAQLESSRELPLHILTQFRITQSFLSTQSPKLAVVIEPLAKRTNILMEKLAPKHAQMLKTLLEDREVLWRDWKKNKFKPAMKKIPTDIGTEENKKVIDLATLSSSMHEQVEDNELSFLQPLSNLCQVSRDIISAVPSIDTHLESYVDALDPDAGIEEEYSPKHDQVMSWQALRLLSQQHLSYFSHITAGGDFENVVRKVWHEQKGQEIPGEYLKEDIVTNINNDKETDEKYPDVNNNDKTEMDGNSFKKESKNDNAMKVEIKAEQDDRNVKDENISLSKVEGSKVEGSKKEILDKKPNIKLEEEKPKIEDTEEGSRQESQDFPKDDKRRKRGRTPRLSEKEEPSKRMRNDDFTPRNSRVVGSSRRGGRSDIMDGGVGGRGGTRGGRERSGSTGGRGGTGGRGPRGRDSGGWESERRGGGGYNSRDDRPPPRRDERQNERRGGIRNQPDAGTRRSSYREREREREAYNRRGGRP